jgi:hypothetical protein
MSVGSFIEFENCVYLTCYFVLFINENEVVLESLILTFMLIE